MNEKSSVLGSPHLTESLASMAVSARLHKVCDGLAGRKVFTTSFGLEDQVLTHFICSEGLDCEIVTLDGKQKITLYEYYQ